MKRYHLPCIKLKRRRPYTSPDELFPDDPGFAAALRGIEEQFERELVEKRKRYEDALDELQNLEDNDGLAE